MAPIRPAWRLLRMRASRSPRAALRHTSATSSTATAVQCWHQTAYPSSTTVTPGNAAPEIPVAPASESANATTARTDASAVAPCALEREHKFIVTDTLLLEQPDHRLEARVHAVLGIGMPRLFRAQRLVDRLNALDLRRIGLATVGVIADDIAALVECRRDVGEHPVMAAVLCEIDDVGEDLLPGLERIPQQLEDGAWHLGVADQAVGGAHQLLPGVLRHADEDIVGVGDAALEIGLRDDQLLLSEQIFHAGRLYRTRHR